MLINVRATILLQFGKGLCKKSVHLSHMDRFLWSLSMVITAQLLTQATTSSVPHISLAIAYKTPRPAIFALHEESPDENRKVNG